MTKYTCAEYSTRALLDAAIIALDTTTTFKVYEYKDAGKLKFMLVSPDPSKGT